MEGIAALLGSENGSRYRGVSQLQSHQSRYSVQILVGNEKSVQSFFCKTFFRSPWGHGRLRLRVMDVHTLCALNPPPKVKPQIVLAKAFSGNLRESPERFKGI